MAVGRMGDVENISGDERQKARTNEERKTTHDGGGGGTHLFDSSKICQHQKWYPQKVIEKKWIQQHAMTDRQRKDPEIVWLVSRLLQRNPPRLV